MKIIISQQQPIVPLMIIILKMKVKEIRTLSIKEYLNMIKPYLADIKSS